MDFCILGPLEVLDRGRPVGLGGGKQRALLALLLLHAGEAVSTDRLVDELWGERPPATAAKLVQGYVAALRKLLPDGVLVTRAPGYLVGLDGAAHSLDLRRFETLVAAAKDAPPEHAVGLLREALALWRGPALGDVWFGGLAASEAAGLDGSRLVALTQRIELELALGRHADLVGELERLVAEHPFQERLRAQLILALYRSGRQAEALEAYRDAHRALDELGIAPSAELERLEKAVLTHDQSLETPLQPEPLRTTPPTRTSGSATFLPTDFEGSKRRPREVGDRHSDSPSEQRRRGPAPAREQRKTVTVLFCDVTASTALGESVDPEALRALLARYFKPMKSIVERHGGAVEKFIGDAVMAVFGVPAVHEDDALRAVRAAAEMRAAFPELGVQGRIGINTGEVLTGTEERLATGDAVNVAARLQQAAEPGEVLLGEATFALAREALGVEPVKSLELKGKSERVSAYRLVSVHEAPERSHESRFVGRERELTLIHDAWGRVRTEENCEAVTIVGDAGMGKSRLVAEALASIDARAVRGRCLSYGEGITFWPVIEVIKQLDALPSDPAAAALIRSLLREADDPTSAEEIAWAFRKLLEEQAPLVVVFDDIQWGEETFLDLVEHLALLSAGAPILILCLARRELAERRREWPVALMLGPLPEAEVAELIPEKLTDQLRERITRASGGNPLFVTEMVAMAAESKGEVVVPPTLKALLAARLDQLDGGDRSALERGAVEGEIFHLGAVQALSGSRPVTPRLASLVRKDLIRPDKAQIPAEDAFRFRHILIRDAAYESISKRQRADLHEQFAGWLEQRGATGAEHAEIVGYHLEHAALYRRELGAFDREAAALSVRAARHLSAAGFLACSRGDDAAMSQLLARAAALHPADSMERIQLLPELGRALTRTGEFRRAEAVLAEAIERARAAGDRPLELDTLLAQQMLQNLTGREQSAERATALASQAIAVFAELGDDVGMARGWSEMSIQHLKQGRLREGQRAVEKQIEHALHARDPRVAPSFGLLARIMLEGSTPVRRGLRICEELLARANGRRARTSIHEARGELKAMVGNFAGAREDVITARDVAEEFGLKEWAASMSMRLGDIELLAGNPSAAEETLRPGCEALEEIGDLAHLSSATARLARALYELGRYEEAFRTSQKSEKVAAGDDLDPQTVCRMTQAKVLAQWGQFEHAERLAREAVRMSEPTDLLNLRADALGDLAEVLHLAGRRQEAITTHHEAIDLYETKGNVVSLEKARTRLDELGATNTPVS